MAGFFCVRRLAKLADFFILCADMGDIERIFTGREPPEKPCQYILAFWPSRCLCLFVISLKSPRFTRQPIRAPRGVNVVNIVNIERGIYPEGERKSRVSK